MSELYPRILQHVLDTGDEVAPRGQATVEVSPFAFELTDPTQCLVLQKARRLNYAFVVAERLALMTGDSDPEMLCHYVSGLRQYLNDEGCFDGAYGPRVRPQLDYAYEELLRDSDSRRAVVSIYSATDQHESVDVPCTLTLQFLIRSGRLDLIVNMRSSDLFLGLPYDVAQFAFLQEVVAGWLAVPVGRYIHWTASAHVYNKDRVRVAFVLESPGDWHSLELSAPKLSRNQAMQHIARLKRIETLVREGAPTLDQIPDLNELAPEYRKYVTLLVRHRAVVTQGPALVGG